MTKNIESCFAFMEQVKGVEPSSQPWEGRVLPINYTCLSDSGVFYQPDV